MKRTLKRELKVLEIVNRETFKIWDYFILIGRGSLTFFSLKWNKLFSIKKYKKTIEIGFFG